MHVICQPTIPVAPHRAVNVQAPNGSEFQLSLTLAAAPAAGATFGTAIAAGTSSFEAAAGSAGSSRVGPSLRPEEELLELELDLLLDPLPALLPLFPLLLAALLALDSCPLPPPSLASLSLPSLSEAALAELLEKSPPARRDSQWPMKA